MIENILWQKHPSMLNYWLQALWKLRSSSLSQHFSSSGTTSYLIGPSVCRHGAFTSQEDEDLALKWTTMLDKLHRGQDYRSHPRQQGCLSKECKWWETAKKENEIMKLEWSKAVNKETAQTERRFGWICLGVYRFEPGQKRNWYCRQNTVMSQGASRMKLHVRCSRHLPMQSHECIKIG